MNDPEPVFDVTIEMDDDLPVSAPEIRLLADFLPQLIKDILAKQADKEE